MTAATVQALVSISREEAFGLQVTLTGQPIVAAFVKRCAASAQVVRKQTGVGFFATITFPEPLPGTDEQQWDWNFKHPEMPSGGSFVCFREAPCTLGLEAVSFEGDWPGTFDAEKFSES